MENEAEKIGVEEAGKLVGLNPRSLLRAEKDRRISFERNAYGDRLIARKALLDSPVLTLGRAAKVAGLRYEVLRYWVRNRKLAGAFTERGVHAVGYLSYNQAKAIGPSRVEYRKAKFECAVTRKLGRDSETRANRQSLSSLRMILRSVIPALKLTNPHAHGQIDIQKHFLEMTFHAMQLKNLGVDIGKLIPAFAEVPLNPQEVASQNLTPMSNESSMRFHRFRRRARLRRALMRGKGIGLGSQPVVILHGAQPGPAVKER